MSRARWRLKPVSLNSATFRSDRPFVALARSLARARGSGAEGTSGLWRVGFETHEEGIFGNETVSVGDAVPDVPHT